EAGDRATASCLHILVREGMARRISPNDRLASLTLERTPPAVVPSGHRGEVWRLAREAAPRPGIPFTFSPDAWCGELGYTRDQLTGALRGLEERGYLRWLPADRTGGVELLRPHEPLVVDEERMR